MARPSRQAAKGGNTQKAQETSSPQKGPSPSEDQNVILPLARRLHLNAEIEMEFAIEAYLRCIDEDHRIMNLPPISTVSSNLQDREQVVKQIIADGQGSLTTTTLNFIQALPKNHPLHWGYHVPKGEQGSGKYSICPCSPILLPWREQNNIFLEDHFLCKSRSKFFTLDGMIKHLYDRSADDPYHKAAYDYLSALYMKRKYQSGDVPASTSTQTAPKNGIPLSLHQAFNDFHSSKKCESSTLASDAPPGPSAGDPLTGTKNCEDAAQYYTVSVSIPGSLGIECTISDDGSSVYISKILPGSQLLNHANVGDFVHQINQTLVKHQEDLRTDSNSHLRTITMKKRVPQHSQGNKEVSPSYILDGADAFEDWLDKKKCKEFFGFNAPSFKNTWSLQQHKLSVIATNNYIQKVKEKSTPKQNDQILWDSDSDESGPGFSSKKSINPREVSPQEKKFIDTLPQCVPLHQGFTDINATNDGGTCMCPCSKSLERCWLDKYRVYFNFRCCRDKSFTSNGLLDHLSSLGGVHKGPFLDGSNKISPIGCIYHYAAFVYLTMLRKGFAAYPHMKTAYLDAIKSTLPSAENKGRDHGADIAQHDGGSGNPLKRSTLDDSKEGDLKHAAQLRGGGTNSSSIVPSPSESAVQVSADASKNNNDDANDAVIDSQQTTASDAGNVGPVVTQHDGQSGISQEDNNKNAANEPRTTAADAGVDGAVVTQQDGQSGISPEDNNKNDANDPQTATDADHAGVDSAVATQNDEHSGISPEASDKNDSNKQCRCAAGDSCKAPPALNLELSTHHCKACGKKIHSSLLCGMNIDDVIMKHPELVGRKLLGGRMIVQANDNELHGICFTCLDRMTKESNADGPPPTLAEDLSKSPPDNPTVNKGNSDKNHVEDSPQGSLSSDREQESLKLGDTIQYWLYPDTWGDDSTMRKSTIVKILSPDDIYEPHLYLDNGDTVNYGDKIQRVEEKTSEDGITKQPVYKPWTLSNKYRFIPSEDEDAYQRSKTRKSDAFKGLIAKAKDSFLSGGQSANKPADANSSNNHVQDSDKSTSDSSTSSKKTRGQGQGPMLSAYCNSFTFLQRFREEEYKISAKFTKQLLSRPDIGYQKERNKEVSSWLRSNRTVVGARKNNIFISDEPMGDDCFSSQASFILPNGIAARQDDVCLPTPTDDVINKIDNSLFECQFLIKPVHKLCYRNSTKQFLKQSRKGKEVDMRTVCLDAVECVSLRCDDIELVDWATINNSGKIWFCSDIRLSKMLHDTVERVLTANCVSPHQVGFLTSEKNSRPLRFLGFVKTDSDGNLVHSYHINSFVLYSDSTNNDFTKVHCLVTSRHLIACNMQERILQIMQMMQYRNIGSWHTILSTHSIGNQFCFDSLSANALDSMKFQRQSTTISSTATILNLVPTISYSNQLTWIKYGKGITDLFDPKNVSLRSKRFTDSVILSFCDCLLSSDYLTMDVSDDFSLSVPRFLHDHSLVTSPDNVLTRWKEVMSVGGRLEQNPFANWIAEKALVETAVPFSVFTHALCNTSLKNEIMLESTLEIIQQFEIVMMCCRIKFNHFEGDRSTYCLMCRRCNKKISPTTTLCTLLNGAPAAMLIHLNLDGTKTKLDSENSETYAKTFNQWPLMHSSVTAKEISYDSLDGYTPLPCQQDEKNQDSSKHKKPDEHDDECFDNTSDRSMEFSFCEAVKIDSNIQYESKNFRDQTISNTCSMLYTLFESIMDHQKFINEIPNCQDNNMDNEPADYPFCQLRHFITDEP